MRVDSAQRLQIAEGIFAVVSIILLTDTADALIDHALAPANALAFGIPIKRWLLIPTFVGSGFMLLRIGRAAQASLRDGWPIAALVALAGLSTLWSAAPTVSLTWSVGLAGTTAFGFVFILRFTPEQRLCLVVIALGLCLAASLLTLVVPAELRGPLGMRQGTLVGLFHDRNLFGRVAALCSLACAVLALVPGWVRPAALAGGVVSLLVQWASHSLTPQIAFLVAVGVAAMLWMAQRLSPLARRRLLIAAAASGIALAGAVAVRPQRFLGAVERSPTLSGRTVLWTRIIAAIGSRPMLGHGYGGYWQGAAPPPAVPNRGRTAHNGFFDLAAELGVAGVLLFVVPAARYGQRAVRTALLARAPLDLWPPAYLSFLLVLNLAESALLRHKIYWALYVAAVLWSAGNRRSQRSTREP